MSILSPHCSHQQISFYFYTFFIFSSLELGWSDVFNVQYSILLYLSVLCVLSLPSSLQNYINPLHRSRKTTYRHVSYFLQFVLSLPGLAGQSWSFSQWTRQLLGDHDGVECRVRLWDLCREVPAEFRQRDWNSRDFSILFPHRKSWKSKYYRSFI